MHADARKLLWNALQAAERVASFTRGKTFADYQADDLLRSAMWRQLPIAGEALNQLRQGGPDDRERHFKLVEPLSVVAQWSQPEEFAAVLKQAA
jgi:uncharacterized protein with HEPN domain